MIKLVVGLGNPGVQYELTRHNIGWLALDQLSFYDRLNWKNKFKGEFADQNVDGEKVVFLKPQTFMNLSGESVQPLATFFKIKPEEIVVIHDDLDLPYGTIQFKKGGGCAGHNGLKSMKQHLGTTDFLRIRLGIGRPDHGNVSSWVLSGFSPEEEALLGDYLLGAAKSIEDALKQGFEKASGKYSRKCFLKKG